MRKKNGMMQRINNSRGDMNIVAVGIALPLLLVMMTAATDIARLPIVQQQAVAAMHAAMDSVGHSEYLFGNASSLYEDPVAGQTWCAWLHESHPNFDCPTNCGNIVESTCSGAADGQYSDGSTPDIKFVNSDILTTLTDTTLGIMAHDVADITIKSGFFNLLIGPDGKVNGSETVLLSNSDEGGLGYPLDVEQIVADEVIPQAANLSGHAMMSDDGTGNTIRTHLGIIVTAVAIRTRHFFPLPPGMRFGETPVEGGELQSDESTVIVSLVRPMSRNVRLSGPRAGGLEPGLPAAG